MRVGAGVRGVRAVGVGERAAGGRLDLGRGAVAAALMSSPPTTIAVRLATVGPESGTKAVSCGAISTSSIGTPSASPTSCGKIVLVPWPISVEAVRMRIAAVGGELDRRDGRELDLARAGEAGAVPGERQADAGGDPLGPGP